MALPAIIPIILIGGAVAYVATKKPKAAGSKKPNGTTSAKMIDNGSYRYSSDCQEFWLAGDDITKMSPDDEPSSNPSAERLKIKKEFKEKVMAAVDAEREARRTSGDEGVSDRPLWMWEVAMGIAARLAPECAVVEGKSVSPVAAILMALALVVITEQAGENPDEIMSEIIHDLAVIYLGITEVKAKTIMDPRFDIIKFIKKVRQNPGKYWISESMYDEFESDSPDIFFGRF